MIQGKNLPGIFHWDFAWWST